MADQHDSDGASDNPAPSGAELDRMLADAADLAAEVSAEVGTLAVRSEAGNVPIDSLEPDATDIQDKLNELDQILNRTASEVGANTATAMTSVSPPADSTALEVPDFMSEFMDVEKPQPPSLSSDTSTAAGSRSAPILPSSHVTSPSNSVEHGVSAPIPDFMSEFTHPDTQTSSAPANPHALTPPSASRNPPKLGVVGSPVTPIEVQEEPEMVGVKAASPMAQARSVTAPAVVSTGGPTVAIESVPAAPSQGAPVPIEAAETVGPGSTGGMTAPVATLLVRAMETVDRPFARLGPGSRRLIGVLALLMFGASIVVFAASLLQHFSGAVNVQVAAVRGIPCRSS